MGVGAKFGVELEANNFNVVSASGANQFVIGIRCVTLTIPNFSLHHSFHSLKGQFHAPEATRSEFSQLVIRLIRTIQIRFKGRVLLPLNASTRSHCIN
uniref:Uncharacterized protein n=1 Tax=Cajanus cajan TaxID=3821 RepID=A0A151RVN7_CAJCA|nr:hypothetical protein KK1_031784 [Cajanus cajan]